jgi:hypothetical protein
MPLKTVATPLLEQVGADVGRLPGPRVCDGVAAVATYYNKTPPRANLIWFARRKP